ncbi:MAG: hypothetical protein Fur0032_23540 [Terrimicrobiaceae bacterium]
MPTAPRESSEVQLVGALEAKTHLAKLLRRARAGQRIVITQRGKPIAQLGPVEDFPRPKKILRGDMKGKTWISDDFCDELEELKVFFT